MHLNRLFEYLKDADKAFRIPDAMYSFAIPSFLGVQAGQSLNDLTVFVQEFYAFARAEKQNITDGLNRVGAIVDEEGLAYKTRAGWFNANPAIICIPDLNSFSESGAFKAVAFAKEGLINQKTAFKAVKRLEASLLDMGCKFSSKTVIPLTRLNRTVIKDIA
jgi:hypothetical protein